MENASKALLMAGGILIGLLIIGLFTYMLTSAGDLFQTDKDIEMTEELMAYNQEFEAYNRKLLRGTDLISLMNKVVSHNEKYQDNLDEYGITLNITIKDDLKVYKKETKYNPTTHKFETTETINEDIPNSLSAGTYKLSKNENSIYSKLQNIKEQKTATFNDFKRRVFDCIEYEGNSNVKYNKYGRICELTYVERKIDYSEGY